MHVQYLEQLSVTTAISRLDRHLVKLERLGAVGDHLCTGTRSCWALACALHGIAHSLCAPYAQCEGSQQIRPTQHDPTA